MLYHDEKGSDNDGGSGGVVTQPSTWQRLSVIVHLPSAEYQPAALNELCLLHCCSSFCCLLHIDESIGYVACRQPLLGMDNCLGTWVVLRIVLF